MRTLEWNERNTRGPGAEGQVLSGLVLLNVLIISEGDGAERLLGAVGSGGGVQSMSETTSWPCILHT